MDEFERIARIWRPLAKQFPGARDLIDDVAILTIGTDEELVVTTDAIVEGVHFFSTDPPGAIAQKLLRVNLSDLAAKGATPLAYSLVTALPPRMDDNWLAAFAAGLQQDQAEFGIVLCGGDSVATSGPAVFTMTAFGRSPKGQTISRSGAQPGDHIFVTGTIGDSALGCLILKKKLDIADGNNRDFLIQRYYLPQPRLGLASLIRSYASATIDVSDGLVADLDHICTASGVGADLHLETIPFSAAARYCLDRNTPIEQLLAGGDDYEIALTVPNKFINEFNEKIKDINFLVKEIGLITKGPLSKTKVLTETQKEISFAVRGWRHQS